MSVERVNIDVSKEFETNANAHKIKFKKSRSLNTCNIYECMNKKIHLEVFWIIIAHIKRKLRNNSILL